MAKVDKLIEQSKEHLSSDENIIAVVMGAYETELLGNDTVRNGIFLATDNRILFFAKKIFGFDLESFPYSNISSIEVSKDVMGHIISFFSSGNKVSMKWINDKNSRMKDVDGFIESVRNKMGRQTTGDMAQENPDILDQIKKLSELKEQGILTEEEFSAKKQELLAKI